MSDGAADARAVATSRITTPTSWPISVPTASAIRFSAPHSTSMMTKVVTVPTNDPIAIEANRSSAWHSAYRMPLTAARKATGAITYRYWTAPSWLAASSPGPAIEMIGFANTTSKTETAIPASPIQASTAPDRRRARGRPPVSRAST